MSEEKKDVPAKLTILEQLRNQHSQFVQQKDFAQNNLNQLIGAIYACEVMIKKHEEEEKLNLDSKDGETEDGNSNEQNQEQTA